MAQPHRQPLTKNAINIITFVILHTFYSLNAPFLCISLQRFFLCTISSVSSLSLYTQSFCTSQRRTMFFVSLSLSQLLFVVRLSFVCRRCSVQQNMRAVNLFVSTTSPRRSLTTILNDDCRTRTAAKSVAALQEHLLLLLQQRQVRSTAMAKLSKMLLVLL